MKDALHGTPYRTLSKLAEGGMGEVVLAEHVELGRTVVVKLLLDSLAGDERLVDRMRVEARILGAIDHPNVVSVLGFDLTPAGRPYLVMERLRGCTLREHVRAHGNLEIYEAMPAVLQMLAGLQAAHEMGVIHRDIKLSNIFLEEINGSGGVTQRRVKLLDFGIGKVLAEASVPKPRYPTQEGTLVGTPAYAAPEQITARAVDARTDVYAAGLVAYALVAGRGPFSELKDARALLRAHLSAVPQPPSAHCPAPLPPELDHVILKALEKRPDDRFRSAKEMASALEKVVGALRAPVGYAETTTWDLAELRSTRHSNPESAMRDSRVAVAPSPVVIGGGAPAPETSGRQPRRGVSDAKLPHSPHTPPTLLSAGIDSSVGDQSAPERRSLALMALSCVAVCCVILAIWWLLA